MQKNNGIEKLCAKIIVFFAEFWNAPISRQSAAECNSSFRITWTIFAVRVFRYWSLPSSSRDPRGCEQFLSLKSLNCTAIFGVRIEIVDNSRAKTIKGNARGIVPQRTRSFPRKISLMRSGKKL